MDNIIVKLAEYLKKQDISTTSFSSPNILYILGVHYKEVITCRLIKAIIEPDGFHGLGNEPLKLFLKEVLGVETTELKETEIVLEEPIKDNRRVDIAIYNNGVVYPIEVKIWAKDQKNQVFDYYNYYEKDKKESTIDKIYYLTPDGHWPSKESQKNLESGKIKCISFFDDINRFLGLLKPQINGVDNEEFKIILNNFTEVINVMCASYKNQSSFSKAFEELGDAGDKNNLLAFLNQKDKLWEELRRSFIFDSLDEYGKENSVEFMHYDFDEPNNFVDPKCKYTIEYNGKKAYVCIDTNLYIVRHKNTFDNGFPDGWEQYENSDYAWHYIYKKGKEKWNLKAIDVELYNCIIDWSLYL